MQSLFYDGLSNSLKYNNSVSNVVESRSLYTHRFVYTVSPYTPFNYILSLTCLPKKLSIKLKNVTKRPTPLKRGQMNRN